jgi:hypothetical protein
MAHRTGWRVDETGRLLSPDGAFVAMLKDGVILFYDRKRSVYVPFTIADWWALMADDLGALPTGPPGKSAGAWGGE